MATGRGTQVRDRDRTEIESKLVAALRRRREATIADLVTDTALPKIRVEEGMRTVLHEYVGHLKATESGELLYSFPTGMRNQVRGLGPSLRRGLRAFGRGTLKVLGFLFRVWIAVMLVGYFALFVALFVLAIVASIAASMAGRGQGNDRDNRRGGGGFMGFYLVSRIIDLLFLRLILGRGTKTNRSEKGRPLHQAVFAYVFGEKDTEKEWIDRERQVLLRHLRANKGVITTDEVMRITGRDRDDAERVVTQLLVEYEGEPQVTERGTVVHFFPELLRTKSEALAGESRSVLPPRPLIPFNTNKPKANGWITFFNVFNLAFGGYFLVNTVAYQAGSASAEGIGWFFYFVGNLMQNYLVSNPLPILGIGLGLVPVAFSVVFFLVPLLRRVAEERKNERIREQNVRRDVVGRLLARPVSAVPEELAEEAREQTRALGGGRRVRVVPRNLAGFVTREVERFAAAKRAEVEARPDGKIEYRFPELAEELSDVERHRAAVNLKSYDVGKTVFDSSN